MAASPPLAYIAQVFFVVFALPTLTLTLTLTRRHSLLPFITIRRPCPRLFGWSPTCPNVTPPRRTNSGDQRSSPGNNSEGREEAGVQYKVSHIRRGARCATAEPDERSKAPETIAGARRTWRSVQGFLYSARRALRRRNPTSDPKSGGTAGTGLPPHYGH